MDSTSRTKGKKVRDVWNAVSPTLTRRHTTKRGTFTTVALINCRKNRITKKTFRQSGRDCLRVHGKSHLFDGANVSLGNVCVSLDRSRVLEKDITGTHVVTEGVRSELATIIGAERANTERTTETRDGHGMDAIPHGCFIQQLLNKHQSLQLALEQVRPADTSEFVNDNERAFMTEAIGCLKETEIRMNTLQRSICDRKFDMFSRREAFGKFAINTSGAQGVLCTMPLFVCEHNWFVTTTIAETNQFRKRTVA
jgi:hypothetical protein